MKRKEEEEKEGREEEEEKEEEEKIMTVLTLSQNDLREFSRIPTSYFSSLLVCSSFSLTEKEERKNERMNRERKKRQ